MCYVILSSILRKTVSHYISVNTNDDDGTRPNARARLLSTTAQLERSAHQVGSKCTLVPWTNIQLRVGWLRTQLKIGVLHRIADGVDTSQECCGKKVLTEKITAA